MTEFAIMVEGQNGLNWPRWQKLAKAVEDLGFAGLYRSDHFTNPEGPALDSLELWVSLTWLPSQTRRIEFGSLVSPVSFRDPVMTARMAVQVNDLSGGRLRLGVGAGWQVREHDLFGYDLLDLDERFDRFTEGLEVITRLIRSSEPAYFKGKYYRLEGGVLLPRERPLPVVIGGNGEQRTLRLVARYADEWNGVFITAARFRELNNRLDRLLVEAARPLSAVKRTLMTNIVYGRSQADLQDRLAGRSADELRQRGLLGGTGAQIKDQLALLDEAGVSRVMLQWLDLDGIDRLESFSKEIM